MEERKGFGSNFGFLMAAIGSAVGLGNIWGFPNKMGANGGFTFLIIYLILAACCGFIVMMGELALGRKTGRGAIGAYKVLSKRFKWLGWLGVLSAFLILGFYCALGGYCLKYVTLNVGNLFHAGFGTGTLDPTGKLGGPSLLFVTMQNVFDRMGAAGPIFGILFYLLVVFAAVSSSISLLEAVVAHFVDKARDEGKGDKRKLYSLIGAIGAGILCVIVCLDALGNAGISPADILGMRVDPSDEVPTWSADWLDFFDCIAEGILMPLGALLMSIMYGWELGPEVVHAEATREGQKFGAYGWFRICIKYITPLAMLLVLYGQIKEFFF